MTVIASKSASVPLTLRLLGPMQVLIHGHPLPHLRSRKTLWLLALLSLRQDRPVLREWLAGTLWPDADQNRAFTSLRATLSELHSALEDRGERLQSPSRHALFLDLTGVDVDLPVFDAAMHSQNPEAMKQAIALYRGPLLEGCNEEWVVQEREQREQHCLQALQMLGDAALAAGDHGAAISYYQRAVSRDPWREAARRGWMEALARGGDRNAAMQVYRDLRDLLRTVPGYMPAEETSALYTRLRAEAAQHFQAQATALAKESVVVRADTRGVSGYLPHPLTHLIGREQERVEVAANLRTSRLATLTGLGGIGKTRLAIEVAAEGVQDGVAYPDGVWLVALESLSEGQQIVPRIAAVFGIREELGSSLLERLSDYLRTRRLLLVLDNCEHLIQACAHVVSHLLRECGRIRILATSRETLGIPGEAVFHVPSLRTPNPKQLTGESATPLQLFADYASIQLFIERAQERQKDFELTHNNAPVVAQICFQLDGIPLAIELAAARVHSMTVEQIACRLDDRLSLLTGGSRAAPPRQKTLRATLDWSFALLSVPEQLLLARLSVFAGGTTLAAVEKVCSGAEIEPKQTMDLLRSLTEKSLVVFEMGQPQGRYHLLETVQQYAAERLANTSDEEVTQEKHLTWFRALAEEAETHRSGPKQDIRLRQLDQEYGNLRMALSRSVASIGKAEDGTRLAIALWWYWRARGCFREGVEFLQTSLELEETQAETPLQAKALNLAGDLANCQSDFASARAFGTRSVAIYRQLGDRQGIAHALNGLGLVAGSQGDYSLARTYHEESLALRREIGDKQEIALSLNNLGMVAREQCDYESARSFYEQALMIRREAGNKGAIADSLIDLGLLAQTQGDYEIAKALYDEGLAINRERADRIGIARSLYYRGACAFAERDYGTATALLTESLTLYRETRQSFAIHVLGALGHVAREGGDYAQAATLYRESLLLRREQGDMVATACSLEDLAGLAARQMQFKRAVRLLGSAESVCRTLGRAAPLGIRKEYAHTVAAAGSALSEYEFAATWADGQALSLEQAVEFALIESECRVGIDRAARSS